MAATCAVAVATGLIMEDTNTKTRRAIRPQLHDGMNTTGCVLCDHARFVDLTARKAEFSEHAPQELIRDVLRIIGILISPDSN